MTFITVEELKEMVKKAEEIGGDVIELDIVLDCEVGSFAKVDTIDFDIWKNGEYVETAMSL